VSAAIGPRPGGFAWLALHEIRLAWRARPRRGVAKWLGYAVLLGWLALGCFLGWILRDQPIHASAAIMTGVLAASIVGFSFMTTQAMLGSQRTLYETGDLALLFSAPIPGRVVLLAKLLGIAGTIVLTYAVLLLTLVVPIAVLGHPQLLGVAALLAALALAAAATGLALTLALTALAGPRAARTVGQVVAAVLGGAIFLISQLLSHNEERRESGAMLLFERFRARGIGSTGLSGLPGHAAFGDPLAILILLGAGILLFALAGATLQHRFLTGYQDGGARLSRARPTGRAMARLFHAGLVRAVFAKEWRLLARDPALAFQIVLRLIYLAPLVFVAFGRGGAVPLTPGLAFASVLIASQLVGSFAWLTVSAEDAPDLLTVAPVAKETLGWAKLMAAFAMAAPIGIILPIAIALRTLPGALVTLACTIIGGAIAGYVELKLGKPGQRAGFARRRSGSAIAGIVSILIALIFGGSAATAVFFLG
jgi:ABC-2 type transport system permease protein